MGYMAEQNFFTLHISWDVSEAEILLEADTNTKLRELILNEKAMEIVRQARLFQGEVLKCSPWRERTKNHISMSYSLVFPDDNLCTEFIDSIRGKYSA